MRYANRHSIGKGGKSVYMPKNTCVPQQTVISNVQLAAAYVPFQKYCGVLAPMEALSKGTAFMELYSPYRKREFANIEPEIAKRCYCEGRRS
jgi:hypothetical protein